ncbi:MAG: hypothetical protein ACC645_26270, partial [Pirellulales bacterium]
VSVGAPGYDVGGPISGVIDGGAVYVFYELPNQGSNNGTTWVRSTGASGSGRLAVVGAAGADPSGVPHAEEYRTADRFGTSVAVANGRVVGGIPGRNDTDLSNNILRADIGAFRTFTNGLGTLPDETLRSLRAETFSNSQTSSVSFGNQTLYDSATRTLFVASAAESRVYTYVNEGLHWRETGFLSGGAGSEFGTDIDLDGVRLIVGAPGIDRAFVYTYNSGTRSWNTSPVELSGANYGQGRFGASVAIDGNIVAVGAPAARTRYYSTNRDISTHSVDLGASGVVHVFKRTGSSWNRYRVLMPDDNSLPLKTSTVTSTSARTAGWVGFKIFDSDNFEYFKSTGTYNLDEYSHSSGGLDDNTVAVSVGARTKVKLEDNTIVGDSGDVWLWNYSYTSFLNVNFVDGVRVGNDVSDLRWIRNDVDVVKSWTINPTSLRNESRASFSFAGDSWGASVDVEGTRVFVGAPGVEDRVAVYDAEGSRFWGWRIQVGSISEAPLRSLDYVDSFGNDLGTEVVAGSTTRFFASAPRATSGAGQVWRIDASSSTVWNNRRTIQPISGQVNGGFGRTDSIDLAGNRLLVAAPDKGSGEAYLYDGLGVQFNPPGPASNVTFRPYQLSGNQMADVNNAGLNFGVGAEL